MLKLIHNEKPTIIYTNTKQIAVELNLRNALPATVKRKTCSYVLKN